MNKIQCYVSLLHLRVVVADERFAELGEDCAGRRLALHKPAVVEAELALRELHGLLLLFVQSIKRGQKKWKVIHDVTQSMVVVTNRVPSFVLVVRAVLLLYNGKKHLHLHDVVNGGQCQQGDHPLLIHLQSISILDQKLRIGEELLEVCPLALFVKLQTLLGWKENLVPFALRLQGDPILINAKGEPFPSIILQAHQPIDGKEGTDSALIFAAHCPARGCGKHFGVTLVVLQKIPIKLRERSKILVEFC
mmetsp:Transcript_45916/g.86137  ORF Transcript_45916/g.86137 Transcript_45916/m.86137 type:complete len:249 (+) Transcript_45916:808-1554(+)